MESTTIYYRNPDAMQPTVCDHVDENGELVWGLVEKAPWHTKMFPVRYHGDLAEQWLFLIMKEKGFEWESEDEL